VPESKGRKEAADKKKSARKASVAEKRAERERLGGTSLTDRRGWVAPTFITLMLFGVAWLVVWYITGSTGVAVPLMSDLGNWNMLIGMGAMGASFGVATLWK